MSATLVKELRDRTGAGIMDCKSALEQTNGDIEKAVAILREKGLASADKKKGRAAADGLVVSYIHNNNRFGALVEINCETDFVARTDDFQQLANDIALHIVAMQTRYVTDAEVSETERQAGANEFGSEEAFLDSTVLMRQPFIKDTSFTVEQLIRESIGKLGENIIVRRFARFELGESATDEAEAEA